MHLICLVILLVGISYNNACADSYLPEEQMTPINYETMCPDCCRIHYPDPKEGRVYLAVEAGYAHSTPLKNSFAFEKVFREKIDDAPIIGAAIGISYTDKPNQTNVRLELEVQHKAIHHYFVENANADEKVAAKIHNTSGFINLAFDVPIFESAREDMKFIMMGGIGISKNKVSDYNHKTETDTVFSKDTTMYNLAWQIGVGVGTKINCSTNLDIMFKYIDRGKIKNRTYYNCNDEECFIDTNKIHASKQRVVDLALLLELRFKL